MSGSGRPLVPAIILLVAVFFAAYSAIEYLYYSVTLSGEEVTDYLGTRKETGLLFLAHLWRPVLISIAIYALIRLLITLGHAPTLRVLGNISAGIAVFVGKLASWIIVPLVFTIMLDVITRKIEYIKVANAEITETYGFSVSFLLQDFQWHMHGVLLLMTFGFGYIFNSHVRVDIFREAASRAGQVKIETFGLTILAIPFMIVMIGFAWDLTYASWRINEASESMVGLGMRYIIKSFLIWGFSIAMMAAVGTLIRCLLYTYGDDEEQALAEDKIQFFTDNDTMAKVIVEQNEREA